MKKLIKYLFCFCLSLLAFSVISFAQNIQVKAQLDSNKIKIGQQTEIILTVDYRTDKGEVKIKWPVYTDTLIKSVEVINKSSIDSTHPNKESDPYQWTLTQHITITSFDSGYHAIPPFQFVVNNDTTNAYLTEPLLLEVQTLSVDTAQASIKDIKLPYDAPLSFKEIIPYLIIGAIIIGLILLILYLFSKRKKVVTLHKKAPPIPPHIIALKQLNEVKDQKLWQQGKTKAYYTSISDILRIYIENRFYLHALEQTTDDILKSFRSMDIEQESKSKLRQVLILADLVKFAKEQPLPNENEITLENAISFVEATAQKEEHRKEENDVERN